MKKVVLAMMALMLLIAMPFAAQAESAELVANGDFEELAATYDLPRGWEKDIYDTGLNSTITCEQAEDHGNVVKIYSEQPNDTKLVQEIAVAPKSLYKFSCDVKTENVTGGAGANISITGVAGVTSGPVLGTNYWTRITFYGETGPSQTTVNVCVRIGGYSADSSGTAWFDNVSVEKVTEVPTGYTAKKLYTVASSNNNKNNSSSKEENQKYYDVPHTGDMLAAVIFTGLLGAILYYRFMRKSDRELKLLDDAKTKDYLTIILVLLAAFLIRVAANFMFTNTAEDSVVQYGYRTDMQCFTIWGQKMAETGPQSFYSSVNFCDYPPAYIYIIGFLSTIIKALGLEPYSAGAALILKMPAILSDIGLSYMVYRLARRTGRAERSSYAILYLIAFNPVLIFLSAVWGQVDSVLTILLLGSALLFLNGTDTLKRPDGRRLIGVNCPINWRLILAAAIYAVAVMIKPQALMFGPILAVAYIMYIICAKNYNTKWHLALATTAISVIAAINVIALLAIPCFGLNFLGIEVKDKTEVAKIQAMTPEGEDPAVQPIVTFGKDTVVINQDGLLDKLIGTATSYNYASVEAFNFMSLIDGNWKNADKNVTIFERELGITYAQLGTAFMVQVIIATMVFYIINAARGRSTRFFILCMAFMMTGLFAFGHFMHERYLFPALIMLLVSAVLYNDRRLYGLTVWFTASMLLNTMCAFVISDWSKFHWGDTYKTLTTIGSAMTVLGALYLLWVTISILLAERNCPAFFVTDTGYTRRSVRRITDRDEEVDFVPALNKFNKSDKKSKSAAILPLKPTDNKLHMKRLDWVFLCGLTLIYAVIAVTNLGSTQAPESAWVGSPSSDPVIIQFDSTKVDLNSIYVFGGIAKDAKVAFMIKDVDGNTVSTVAYTQEYGKMYRWHEINGSLYGSTKAPCNSVTMVVEKGNPNFIELAFYDKDGNQLKAHTKGKNGAQLVDEQNDIPETFSYMTGMYFDELYHARTGYEHLNGLKVYETSHPPLGKIFISIGIAIFGMNPFGWRIIGTLFGVAMVPVIYIFAKRIFKRSGYALATTILFTFDFMHYTQTRIATIDSYAVFFILLMFYYMYQYYRMNFFVDGLKKTLKPLALAGLFFGLGAASKWICFYAGAGLAIILFMSLFKRFREYTEIRKRGTPLERKRAQDFWKNVLFTLLWCCLFYIVIPVAIYLASYLVFPDIMALLKAGDIKGAFDRFWNHYQKYCMLDYHSNLSTPHTFSAAWYDWPLILRPMWFYKGVSTPEASATISTFGNPIVWWLSLVGFICFIRQILAEKIKATPATTILIIGVCANLMPWMLVTRSTYIYHYFATIPFMLFAAMYFVQSLEKKYAWMSYFKYVWAAIAVVLFGVFYPVTTGVPVSRAYIDALQWLPRWHFMGVEGPDVGRQVGMIAVILMAAVFVIGGVVSRSLYKSNKLKVVKYKVDEED